MERAKAFLTGGPSIAFGQNLGGGTSYVMPAIAAIIGFLIIAMIVFVIVRATQGHPKQTLTGPVNLFSPQSPVLLSRTDTAKSMKGSYTFAFYMRVDAVPDMRASTPLLTWPGVWNMALNPAEEQLAVNFTQTVDENAFLTADSVVIPGATLQRWNEYVMAVEGRSVDFYINGTLIKSAILDNVPKTSNSSITIVPGNIMGQVAYVQLWDRRLTIHEVQNNYAETADSQGQPYISPSMFAALSNVSIPNLFCSGGSCAGNTATAAPTQIWEFPYA